MCCILLWQPSDLVDFLFNLQTLQVVKVRLVALECAVDIVLPRVPRLPHLLRFSFRLAKKISDENKAVNENVCLKIL